MVRTPRIFVARDIRLAHRPDYEGQQQRVLEEEPHRGYGEGPTAKMDAYVQKKKHQKKKGKLKQKNEAPITTLVA